MVPIIQMVEEGKAGATFEYVHTYVSDQVEVCRYMLTHVDRLGKYYVYVRTYVVVYVCIYVCMRARVYFALYLVEDVLALFASCFRCGQEDHPHRVLAGCRKITPDVVLCNL